MPDQNGNVINLGDFAKVGEHALIGQEKGLKARQKSNLEAIAQNYDKVKIIVPDGIYAVNPSFLVEFLKPVVKRLGEKRFYERFEFDNQGP